MVFGIFHPRMKVSAEKQCWESVARFRSDKPIKLTSLAKTTTAAATTTTTTTKPLTRKSDRQSRKEDGHALAVITSSINPLVILFA